MFESHSRAAASPPCKRTPFFFFFLLGFAEDVVPNTRHISPAADPSRRTPLVQPEGWISNALLKPPWGNCTHTHTHANSSITHGYTLTHYLPFSLSCSYACVCVSERQSGNRRSHIPQSRSSRLGQVLPITDKRFDDPVEQEAHQRQTFTLVQRRGWASIYVRPVWIIAYIDSLTGSVNAPRNLPCSCRRASFVFLSGGIYVLIKNSQQAHFRDFWGNNISDWVWEERADSWYCVAKFSTGLLCSGGQCD